MARYSKFRHKSESGRILAEALRDLYSDVFSLDENVHKAKREHITGIISRITGQEERQVRLMTSTFIALCKLADFDAVPTDTGADADEDEEQEPQIPVEATTEEKPQLPQAPHPQLQHAPISFRHNIEIHLPATTNIAVYNAIFKSLKEHLFD